MAARRSKRVTNIRLSMRRLGWRFCDYPPKWFEPRFCAVCRATIWPGDAHYSRRESVFFRKGRKSGYMHLHCCRDCAESGRVAEWAEPVDPLAVVDGEGQPRVREDDDA